MGGSHIRLLMQTTNHAIFYIFECNLLKQFSHTMKLQVPFSQHYYFSKIKIYKEEAFDEKDEYITISYLDANVKM